MSKQRPTEAEIIDLIGQPHFRRKDAGDAPSTDPITPTPMVVEVEQIKPYDRNPRRVPNSERDLIKASIRASGMDQPLTITRRPEDEHYMVAAGGNTRLQVVRELWQETRDDRFQHIHCLFRPWGGDTNVLVAHLKENDLRGDLTFIDRALAVRDLRQLIEQEDGGALPVRKLADRLQERGYGIGKTMLSWFDYTVEVLYPAIPTALEVGMGRPQVERIRTLERAYNAVWTALELGDGEAARALFVAVLARMDDDALDLEALRLNLCDELMMSSDVDLNRIRLGFAAALEGQPVGDLRSNPVPEPEAAPRGAPLTANRESTSESQKPANPEAKSAVPSEVESRTPTSDPYAPKPPIATPTAESGAGSPMPHWTQADSEDELLPPKRPAEDASPEALEAYCDAYNQWRSQAIEKERAKPFLPFGLVLPPDLPGLRTQAWLSATDFAAKTLLGDCVIALPQAGMGFLVGPADESLVAGGTGTEVRTVIAAWWSLVFLSEQFARHGLAARFMPEEWRERPIGEGMRQAQRFRGWTEEHRTREVITEIPIIGMPDLNLSFLGLPEPAWRNWFYLTTYCRAIHRATHGNPWAQQR